MSKIYEWTVIGAGPAGIAAVDKLLQQYPARNICWIDPEFAVGDFGTRWQAVSSNTKIKLFNQFNNHCRVYQDINRPSFKLEKSHPEKTCLLKEAAEPLRWITQQLMQSVTHYQAVVKRIYREELTFTVECNNGNSYKTHRIVLAIGAEPKSLNHPGIKEIPLVDALDIEKLKTQVKPKETVAVFGSSHSAIIVIRDLLHIGAHVINFYQSPLRYAVYFDDWILFDNTGLKGETAEWAKKNLHDTLPDNLTRVLSTPEMIKMHLPNCEKAVYAVGFKARQIEINGHCQELDYNHHTGIISPGLFGLGIAFPEFHIDKAGNKEYRVGLAKFMDYLNRIFPLWVTSKMPQVETVIS